MFTAPIWFDRSYNTHNSVGDLHSLGACMEMRNVIARTNCVLDMECCKYTLYMRAKLQSLARAQYTLQITDYTLHNRPLFNNNQK